MKPRHFLLFFLLLQMIFPIAAMILGDLAGILVGSLVAATLTLLVSLAMRSMHRYLLRLIEERFGYLAPLVRDDGEAGEPRWLPLMRALGRYLVRGLSPLSFVILLVCLAGILPELVYMLLTFLQVLYLLAIFALVALVMLGETCPDLLRQLVRAQFHRTQRPERQASPVIIVADASDQAAPPGIPTLADGPRLPLLGHRPLDLAYQQGLPATPNPPLLAQLTIPTEDGREGPGATQAQERN